MAQFKASKGRSLIPTAITESLIDPAIWIPALSQVASPVQAFDTWEHKAGERRIIASKLLRKAKL